MEREECLIKVKRVVEQASQYMGNARIYLSCNSMLESDLVFTLEEIREKLGILLDKIENEENKTF